MTAARASGAIEAYRRRGSNMGEAPLLWTATLRTSMTAMALTIEPRSPKPSSPCRPRIRLDPTGRASPSTVHAGCRSIARSTSGCARASRAAHSAPVRASRPRVALRANLASHAAPTEDAYALLAAEGYIERRGPAGSAVSASLGAAGHDLVGAGAEAAEEPAHTSPSAKRRTRRRLAVPEGAARHRCVPAQGLVHGSSPDRRAGRSTP